VSGDNCMQSLGLIISWEETREILCSWGSDIDG
jgi:hypothetical protein